MVIHHTRCGLESLDEETLREEITTALGVQPPFRLGAYVDVDEDVRATVAVLRASPFVDDTEIRGFVFDVDDGELREVDPVSSSGENA
jgi:carbonic anhydrase